MAGNGGGEAFVGPGTERGVEVRGMVLVPITMCEEAREMGVPEIETTGPPGIRVVPPITKPDG